MRIDFNTTVKLVPIVTATAATKQQQKNKNKSKQRHRDETMRATVSTHGAKNDLSPALDDLVDTILGNFKATEVVEKIFNSKKSVENATVKKCETSFCSDYYKSNNNLRRLLNIYYSYNVMRKRKYVSLRKANKSPNFPNYVPYEDLSKHIRSIDIDRVHKINPSLLYNLLKT